MKYQLTQIKADGSAHRWVQNIKPSLKQMQEAVGGLIERAPECYETQFGIKLITNPNAKLDAIWCNEEALLASNPVPNLFFEPAPWGDRLYGDVLVVEEI